MTEARKPAVPSHAARADNTSSVSRESVKSGEALKWEYAGLPKIESAVNPTGAAAAPYKIPLPADDIEKLAKTLADVVPSSPMDAGRDRFVAFATEHDGIDRAAAEREYEKLSPEFRKALQHQSMDESAQAAPSSLSPSDKKARYVDFVQNEMDLSHQFAAANFERELAPRIEAGLSQNLIDKLTSETFATRPKGDDAIAYYTRVWSKLIGEGRLFLDDIEYFDYPLLRGITNRISLLARTRGGHPSDYYPPHYPPARRPEPQLDEARQKERQANRRASQKYASRLRNPY